MVIQRRHRSPSAPTATRAKLASRSANPVGEDAAARGQPRGQREVVKRDHGLDAGVPQRADHLAVAVERRAVDFAFARLDARPLDRHSVRAEAERLLQRDVTLPASPRVARDVRPVAPLDPPRLPRELEPVAGRAAALDLGGRRGGAEEEGRGEDDHGAAPSLLQAQRAHSMLPSLRSSASRWARTSGSLVRSASTLRTALITVV